MARSIGDALAEEADNLEHLEYYRRALAAAEKYKNEPNTMRTMASIQCDMDHEHRLCSIKAGRRLRRITVGVGKNDSELCLSIEPYQPAKYGNTGELHGLPTED